MATGWTMSGAALGEREMSEQTYDPMRRLHATNKLPFRTGYFFKYRVCTPINAIVCKCLQLTMKRAIM
jgi:hypothetical protein